MWGYALAAMGAFVYLFLPGEPGYEPGYFPVAGFLLTLAVVYGIVKKSTAAWGVAVGLDSFTFVGVAIELSTPLSVKGTGLILLTALQLALLFTAPVRRHVFGPRNRGA